MNKKKNNTNKNLADMHADGVHFDPKELAAKKNNSILQKENLKKDKSAQKSN